MKSKYILTNIICLCLGIVIGAMLYQPGLAGEKTPKGPDLWMGELMDKLSSENDKAREEAIWKIYDEYRKTMTRLTGIIADRTKPYKKDERRIPMIELLGAFHLTETIPTLLDNIGLVSQWKLLRISSTIGGLPCAEALDELDLPVSGILISYLANTPELKIDDRAMAYSAFLLYKIHHTRRFKMRLDGSGNMFENNDSLIFYPYSARETVKKFMEKYPSNKNLQRLLADIEQCEQQEQQENKK